MTLTEFELEILKSTKVTLLTLLVAMNEISDWKQLTASPKQHPQEYVQPQFPYLKPSYYIDINDKEWTILFVKKENSKHSFNFDTFLYDIEKDKVDVFVDDL